MSRRDVLRKAALAASVGLAGCSALQNGSGDVNSEYELTTEDHLARAISELNTVALALREFQAGENPAEATFDDTGPRERLKTAREAIAAAEEAANGDAMAADIQATRAYADTMEGTVTTVQGLDTASTALADIRDNLQSEEINIEAASSTLEHAREASSSAVDAHETATTALESADSDRLQRLNAEYQAMETALNRLSSFVTGVNGLTVGYDKQVAGVDDLQTAEDQVTSEKYDAATEAFSAARPVLEESATAFSDAVDGAADSLVPDLERGDKRSRSLATLAGGYVNLLTGREAISAAQAELEEENLNTAKESLTTGGDEATQALDQFEAGDGILEDEFTDLFETARARATAMSSLADGYTLLVDARIHVSDAESRIAATEYGTARDALDGASTDSTAADEEFAAGQGVAGNLFASEFETARTRARVIDSLSTGYATLLDAREHITAAESHIENGEYDQARGTLQSGSDDAESADQEFEAGQAETGAFFQTEFEIARGRATAVGALSDGYVTLLDARDDVAAGESSFLNEAYGDARTSFSAAADTSETAATSFADGESAAGADIFSEAFERANQRATAVKALSEGYATMVGGREEAQAGRDDLDNRQFDSAAGHFGTAANTIADAETTFSDGKDAAGTQFQTEFDRGLCQAGHLQSAFEHFEAAAEAGSNGNRSKARDEQSKGDEDIGRVDDC